MRRLAPVTEGLGLTLIQGASEGAGSTPKKHFPKQLVVT